jgi:hypothetical protein
VAKHVFVFRCSVNPSHLFETVARGIGVARLRAHAQGWASTSMDSPTAKDICPECLKLHKNYSPGRPFKRSVFAEMHERVIGKVKSA